MVRIEPSQLAQHPHKYFNQMKTANLLAIKTYRSQIILYDLKAFLSVCINFMTVSLKISPIGGNVKDKLQKSEFTATDDDPKDGFEKWRESISVLFDIAPSSRLPEDRFQATLTSYLLNEQVMFSRCHTVEQTFSRSALKTAQDDLDYFLIQTHTAGGQTVKQGSREDEAQVGDLLVLDMAEKHYAETSDYAHLTLVVPRMLLAPLLDQPDDQAGRVLKQDQPLVAMAVEQLRMLDRVCETMTNKESRLVVQPMLSLIAAALNGRMVEHEQEAANVAQSTLFRAKSEISAQIRNPELSTATLCAALGLSRSSLYRLFKPLGGVEAYIREQRLKRCAMDLADPLYKHKKIYEIAYDWGFANETHFSRVFREKFGIAPSDARSSYVGQTSMNSEDLLLHHRKWEQWLSSTLKR